MTKYGSWEQSGRGTGIAPSRPTPVPYPGYTPSPTALYVRGMTVRAALSKCGRGAHIRSSTHLRRLILRVKGYDRGL